MDGARLQRHLRLVVQDELTLRNRPSQRAGKTVAPQRLRLLLWSVDGVAAAGSLRDVHRDVSAPQKGARIVAVHRVHRNTIDALVSTSWSAIENGPSSDARIFLADATTSSGCLASVVSTANSSPPNRAMVSVARRTPRHRAVTS